MAKIMKFIKRVLVGAVLTLLVSAAGPGQAQETLKLGALLTLSGPGATWGQGMLHAAQLAAEDVNQQGGLEVAGRRYMVKIIPYDDQYRANEAVTAANRLIFEDQVKYIIGPVGSAAALAIQPITEKQKVILLTLAFTAKALGPNKPFTFRPVVTTGEMAQAQIHWLVKHQGVKKVGGLFPNDETGQQIASDVATAYAKAGAQLAAPEFFERERVDFVPLLTKMFASNVDALELDGNSPTTAGLIVKQARESGFTGLIVRTGGPATQEIVNVAGKAAAQGLYVHTPVDLALASLIPYERRYEAGYRQPMNGFSPFFYDATRMLFLAMQESGTITDTERVRNALQAIHDYQGVLGSLSWTGEKQYGIAHQINAPFYIAQVREGAEQIVARCTVVAGCQ
jgi:branched-chain amino acid transport system substrate-binding protein